MQGLWRRLDALAPLDASERPTAAVLVALYPDGDGVVRVILIKRPSHMSTHAGQLAFPGGRLEDVDRHAVDAALRETQEEVAIDPDLVSVLGVLPTVTTNRMDVVVRPVVARLAGPPAMRPDPREVARILEPPLGYFFDEHHWRRESWSGHELWFIDVDNEVLWGASARIMRLLLETLQGT